MSHTERLAIETAAAPAAIGPYSQAVRAGALLFVSGQIPLDPVTGDVIGREVEDQTHRVMQSLGAILEAAGASYDQVVRSTIFLTDLRDFSAVAVLIAENSRRNRGEIAAASHWGWVA